MLLEYTHNLMNFHLSKIMYDTDNAVYDKTKRNIQTLKNRVANKRSSSRNRNFRNGINSIRSGLGDRKSTMVIDEKGEIRYAKKVFNPLHIVLRRAVIDSFNHDKIFKVDPKAIVLHKSEIAQLSDWRKRDPYIDPKLCDIPIHLLEGKSGAWSRGSKVSNPLLTEGSTVIITRTGPKWYISSVFKEYSASDIGAHDILKYCCPSFWERAGLLYVEGDSGWQIPESIPPMPEEIPPERYNPLVKKHFPHLEGEYQNDFRILHVPGW